MRKGEKKKRENDSVREERRRKWRRGGAWASYDVGERREKRRKRCVCEG